MGYTLRKEEGTRSPLGRNKRMGYRLYSDGSKVYPMFRNWWPTKKEAESALRKYRAEAKTPHGRAHSSPKKKRKRK